jgi:hypothetical protein
MQERKTEDAQELASVLTGVSQEDYHGIEEALLVRWDIDYDHFEDLVNELALLTYPVESPFGGYFHAFGTFDPETEGVWHALLKTQADVTRRKDAGSNDHTP